MWKTEVSWWLDGTPYELKGSRTVWDGGKGGDNFKVLPIVITNHDIIELGSILLLLTALVEPGRAFNAVVINSLRAAGDVNFPVFIGVLSMWGISVPLAYMLGIHVGLGLVGIWIAFIVDEWLRGVLMLFRWRQGKWRNIVVKKVETNAS